MFRRLLLAAVATAALAAPVLAGKLIDQNPGQPDAPPSGGVTRPTLNILISDGDTGLPIKGATGVLYDIPTQWWARSNVIATASTGGSGYLYYTLTGAKAGTAYNLEVSAPNYATFTTLVWLSKNGVTHAEVDIIAATAAGKQGTPSGAPSSVAATWGQIKALY